MFGPYLSSVHFRGQVSPFSLGVRFLSVGAHFAEPAVQSQGMETVGSGLLSRGFPVGSDDEALWRTQHFHAFSGAAPECVEVPLRIPEKLFQRRAAYIPRCENQAAINGHPCFFQAQLILCTVLAIQALLFHRCANKVTIRLEGPAVVNAQVCGGVASIERGYLHAAVRADV